VGEPEAAGDVPAGGGATRSISHDILLEYALLLLVALALVVIPFAVYMFVTGREDDLAQSLPQRKNWMPALLLSMIGVSVAAVLVLRYLERHRGSSTNPIGQLADLAKNGHKATGAVRFDWGPVIVVSSLAAIGITIVLLLPLSGWEADHTARYPLGTDLIPKNDPSDLMLRGEWEENARRTAQEMGFWTIVIACIAIAITVALEIRRRRGVKTPPTPPPPPTVSYPA